MADQPLPPPDDPPDPLEAELVAYLDGELDDAAARRVEARLAADPAARAKAAALKKTYDLLEYLPDPEPSPTFTTRTLEKVPALKSGSLPVPVPSGTTPAASGSAPVPLSSGAIPAARPRRRWAAAAVVLGAAAFALAGYLGAAALGPHLFPPRGGTDDLPLSDRELIEKLPLYAAVDDLEFAHRLAEPDLFGHEAPPDGARPAAEPERLPGETFEALAKSFKALPPARQQAIRELDRQLQAADRDTRERLARVLDAYAVWLHRLPDSERRGVLNAATPGLRLDVIRDIRERQWVNGLPAAQRARLTALDDAQRGERIRQWKEEEERQRNLWAFVRKNAEAIRGAAAPWPFDDEDLRRKVVEFMREAFDADNPKRSRLNPVDLAAHREALAAAERGEGWAWYGWTVYHLARRYELLPEPADPKLLYRDFADLPPGLARVAERPAIKRKLAPHAGRWPEFPRTLHEELAGTKLPPGPLPRLGPARVAEFQEPVRDFWEKELSRKLTPPEKAALQKLEGRWPDYPREFVRLARAHDLSVPGVTLPGSPRRWDATYGLPGRPARP